LSEGYLVDVDCSAPYTVGQAPIPTVSLTMTYAGPRQRGRLLRLRHTITTQHQVGAYRFSSAFALAVASSPRSWPVSGFSGERLNPT
jgi:hypothetical protein